MSKIIRTIRRNVSEYIQIREFIKDHELYFYDISKWNEARSISYVVFAARRRAAPSALIETSCLYALARVVWIAALNARAFLIPPTCGVLLAARENSGRIKKIHPAFREKSMQNYSE